MNVHRIVSLLSCPWSIVHLLRLLGNTVAGQFPLRTVVYYIPRLSVCRFQKLCLNFLLFFLLSTLSHKYSSIPEEQIGERKEGRKADGHLLAPHHTANPPFFIPLLPICHDPHSHSIFSFLPQCVHIIYPSGRSLFPFPLIHRKAG